MIPDLPSPLLRSFLAITEAGSLAAAGRRVGRSESALSLQMSRLEALVGRRLFDRDGRALRLNQTGSHLLGHARAILSRIDAARAELGGPAAAPVRLGIVQDFVSSILGPALAQIGDDVPMELLVGGSADLLMALGEDRIDIALCATEAMGTGIEVSLPMRWFGQPVLLGRDVLPLVSVNPPCPFLSAASAALDAAGRPWRLAVVTPSLEGVRAAVTAGLGLACRHGPGMMGMEPVAHDGALPALPSIRYAIIDRRRDGQGPAQRLARDMGQQLQALAANENGVE